MDMQFDAIKKKSAAELHSMLHATREALRKARFSAHQKQLKNIRSMRTYKKTIARILTHLRNQ